MSVIKLLKTSVEAPNAIKRPQQLSSIEFDNRTQSDNEISVSYIAELLELNRNNLSSIEFKNRTQSAGQDLNLV